VQLGVAQPFQGAARFISSSSAAVRVQPLVEVQPKVLLLHVGGLAGDPQPSG
jgi:hypothetical protein